MRDAYLGREWDTENDGGGLTTSVKSLTCLPCRVLAWVVMASSIWRACSTPASTFHISSAFPTFHIELNLWQSR